MAKRLNYTIGVDADTSKLQEQLQVIFNSLNSISNRASMAPSIQEASRAALELSQNLQKAINQNTGTLDLGKFNNEIKKSGRQLEDYYDQLSKVGLEGQKTFLNIAQAITSAELPLKRTNKLFDQLWVTMKNTMRWQLTSSVLHGFVGSLEQAYGYAKNLDSSLNNIRIVSGKSAEDMSRFAEQANKAAKALSTTTVDYTDASLIYYQQGLTDQEVLDRTETTIKMANVAGTTAEQASQQLTAVWNNFYDGSQSLDHYADVMVKLGAATASSSDEISEGIEKFAAVANTVGLSYEYAASALATVTAQTRESASVVGTAFRTLFSRIQGLQQGDTLDDGTTLNKYSEALSKVGVQIKDSSGELKRMDQILDDLGGRWNNLAQDQKIALAETVAGVRQWTQLIALMDNWDFFKENLALAQEADGALNQQAKIYGESWKAARDEVKAAAEDIYDSLINPDFYIDVNNMVTPLLTFLAKFIDGMGGLNGILSVSALLMNKVYGDKIAQTMRDMAANLSFMKDSDKQRAISLKDQAVQLSQIALNSKIERQRDVTEGDKLDYKGLEIQRQIIDLEGEAVKYADQLTGKNSEILKGQIERVKNDQKILELITQQNKEATNAIRQTEGRLDRYAASNDKWRDEFKGQQQRDEKGHFTGQKVMKPEYQNATNEITSILNNKDIKTSQQAMKAFQAQLKPITQEFTKLKAVQIEYNANGQEVTETVKNMIVKFGLLDDDLKGLDKDSAQKFISGWLKTGGVSESLTECNNRIEALKSAMLSLTDGSVTAENAIYDLIDAYISLTASGASAEQIQQKIKEKIDEVSKSMTDGSLKTKDWADSIVQVGSFLSSLSMGINALSSAIDNITNPDLSGLEKFSSLMGSLPMILSAYLTIIKMIGETESKETIATIASAAAKKLLGDAAATAVPKIMAFGTAFQAALGPLMLIVSIGATVITLISSIASAMKRAREEQIEQQKEAYKKTKSEIEANEELISSYREAFSTYEKTGDNKSELSQLALEVAEALGIEGAAVANLTGDYKKLNESIRDAEKKKLNEKLNNAQTGKNIYGNSFKEDMREGRGRQVGSDYIVEFTDSNYANTAQNRALEGTEFYQKYGDKSYQQWGSFATSSDPESMVKLYEAGEEAAEAMRKAQIESGEEASDYYNNLIDWLEKSRESYEQYKAVIDEANQAAFQLAVIETGPTDNINSYNDYLDYYKELNDQIEQRVKAGQIEESEVESLRDAYLAGADGIKKYVLQQKLLDSLSNHFGVDFSDNKEIMKSLGQLDEDSLAIAVSIVPEAGTIEEFTNTLEQETYKAIVNAAIESSQKMGELVQNLNKNNSISEEQYDTLKEDKSFTQQMEEDFGTFEDFQMQAQRVQIEYIRDYYTSISQFAVENLAQQQKQAEEEYSIALAKYNALETLEQNHNSLFTQMADLRAKYQMAKSDEEKEKLESNWETLQEEISSNGIDIVFNIEDSNETLDTLDDKLLEIQDRIKNISKQRIEIAVNWDDFDDIKSQMDSLGDFATVMQKDAQKVGNSYQYPIDAVRDWMEVYPDLFKEASVTNQGLIALDKSKVDNYINSKQDEIKANTDAKIEQWELEKKDLEADREVLIAKQKAFTEAEQGKIDVSAMSIEDRAILAQELTQYQIDNGVKESEAQKKTLETMGLNESKYSDVVAGVSQTNTENMSKSSAQGARNTIASIGKMVTSIRAFGNNIKETFKLFTDPTYTPKYKSVWNVVLDGDGYEGHSDDTKFDAAEVEDVDPVEGFKAQKLKEIDLDLSAIDEAIDALDSKILAARAIQNVQKAYEGTKGPNKSSKSNKDNEGTQEKFEESLERYHEITREIEYQEKALDKLDKQIERTYGTKRLDLYTQKIKKLNRLAELEQQKSLAALADVAIDGSELESEKIRLSPKFDEETLEITNYTELLKQAQEEYQNYLTKWNAMTKEQQDAAKEDKEAAKQLYDDRVKALKQYEESVDTYREETEKFEEYLRQIEDTKLQTIVDKLEFVIDAKDLKNAAYDFSKKIEEIFGDALTHGIKVADISAEQARLEADMLPQYQEQYDELQKLLANATEYTDITAIQDQISDLQSKIISSGESIVEFINSIEDIIPDAISAASERFSAFTDQLEHNTSVLDTIKELYALQGVTYKTAAGFNRLQRNSQEKLNAQVASAELQKGWYDEAAKRLEEAQEKLDSLGGNETDLRYDTYKKARDAYLEEFNQAQEAYLSSAKEAMETAQDMYVQQIERATYLFGQAVSNNVGLDLLQDKYDHYIESEERYFDKVNEAYQVASWYNKLQQDIDDTTNVAYKNRLKALQEEIDKRKEGNKLSQYDLDILNAKYQLLQAQQALEDAQNAKNQIQLVRDSQGNWNYQYTANQDDIAKAEQDVLDAQNNWYNIAKDQTKYVAGEIVSMWQECTDAVEQLYKDLANGDISEEEYLKKKEEIEQYYTEKAKYLEEEKTQAIKDMNEAGYEELKNIAEKNGETVKEFENVYAKELESMTDSNKNFADMLDKYLQQCDDKFNNYKDTVKQVASDTGTTLGNLAEETDKVSEATDQVKQRGDEAKYTLWEMADAASGAAEKYLDLANSMWQAVRAMQTLTGAQANFATSKGTKAYDENTDYTSMIIQGLANGYINYGDNTYNSLIKQLQDKAGEGANLDLDQFKSYKKGDTPAGWAAGRYNTEEEWRKNLENLKKNYGLDTGGYTGLFDDAKLAFLHQKELVLNQSDTENILAAVQAVRTIGTDLFKSIEKSLDGNAIAAMALMGQKLNPIATTPVQDSIEQTVHIDKVEFPNVTSRTEIEEAFISLTNDAAQWARRKT